MDKKKSALSSESLLVIGLAIIALFVTTVAVIPSLRRPVRDFFSPEQRTILAKISGDLTGQGLRVTVLKIQQRDSLSLEIYDESQPDQSTLMSKINLPEKRDAYFQLRGNATNLGLSDIDQDGTLEILAPTFDEQMIARLNIYKYNVDTKSFDRVNTPPSGDL